MYTTTRFYYPNGIEGESMKTTTKEFETLEKAIKYCNRYAKGVRFVGVQVENKKGKTVYELTSDGEVTEYTEENEIEEEVDNDFSCLGEGWENK